MAITPQVQARFHQLLGRALTNWQHVETGLYIVAHCCLATSHERSAVVFFHIRSAESKVALVDKLCHCVLSKTEAKAHWAPLRKAVDHDITLRNALAHFEVSVLRRVPKGTEYRVALMPHILDPSGTKGGLSKALYLEQIHQTGDEFVQRARELEAFARNCLPDWSRHSSTLPPDLRRFLGSIHQPANRADRK